MTGKPKGQKQGQLQTTVDEVAEVLQNFRDMIIAATDGFSDSDADEDMETNCPPSEVGKAPGDSSDDDDGEWRPLSYTMVQ